MQFSGFADARRHERRFGDHEGLLAAANVHGHHIIVTKPGLDHRKIAIWAFIGSECMLFASLISTYLIYKGRSVVGPYPHEVCDPAVLGAVKCPTKMNAILNIPVTSMSTFVLLMSSLFMVLAVAFVLHFTRAAA